MLNEYLNRFMFYSLFFFNYLVINIFISKENILLKYLRLKFYFFFLY